MQLTEKQLELLSAAQRHVRDARALLDSSSDQSWHLAAFGPECARKATLPRRHLDRVLGHLGEDGDDLALEFALAIAPEAARYRLRRWASEFPLLAAWRIDCRYEKTRTRARSTAEPLVAEAEALVHRISQALWLDGRIPGDFAW
ncbi:MAG: hypothetical protein A2138_05710 [Deltaproteobacteria bacterium RBG_16_71_12]|nr:MAG: hypothetical protein A2138_05710 [Deltaproteobacteria bacterium RBG_16_71_12]